MVGIAWGFEKLRPLKLPYISRNNENAENKAPKNCFFKDCNVMVHRTIMS